MLHQIQLTNTFSRKKEVFVPLEENHVTLYVCGITPYSHSHIGHGRVYVVFDVLVRLFQFLGYSTTYIRNITDLDDKILDNIQDEHENIVEKIRQFVTPFIDDFHAQLEKLNCVAPTTEPRVTKHIKEIISIIDLLIQNRHAYQIGDDIYFDIATLSSYGSLSQRDLSKLLAGARVETNEKKKNPGDFVLWKGNSSELFWESPWGFGRPGWHIECSAMISKYGRTIDIHGGGADLIFPHHENECAQSEGAFGQVLANYWMHVEFLNLNKEKMSKSVGNLILLKDLLTNHSPMAFRLYLLQHAHTTPLNFSHEDLEATTKGYKRLTEILGPSFILSAEELKERIELPETAEFIKLALADVCDDLNTARAIARFFEHIEILKKSIPDRELVKTFFKHILGITFDEAFKKEAQQQIPDDVVQLMKDRQEAREARNWERADDLRAQIEQRGFQVHDKKS